MDGPKDIISFNGPSDNVTKLKIKAYSDAKHENYVNEMDVQVNPESYTHKTEIKYNSRQGQGNTGTNLRFEKIKPQKMEFEFLFDSTGLINDYKDDLDGVQPKINELRDLVVHYDGEKHRTSYVQLIWGTMLFNCCVDYLEVSYKLFNKEGAPLRAVVRAAFTGSMEDNLRSAKENKQSPDLTHVKVIKEGDTLPLLCHKIYGDSKYYTEVAKINRLNNFRRLKAGEKIIFPPLKK